MPTSFFSHLSCGLCGKEHAGDRVQGLSSCCARPLVAHYDLERARERLRGRSTERLFTQEPSLWRYGSMLPPVQRAKRVTLGEGWTPILNTGLLGDELGMSRLMVKDEGQNPTGTFKARGMALAISRAKALGVRAVSVPTAGNAGGALAAYATRGGLAATVAMPKDAPAANKTEVRAHGVELIEVDGLITDCGALLKQRATQAQERGEPSSFDISTLKEPYRLEGKKTMGYEVWEQLASGLPDVIVYPTGGGTGLIGMSRAFDELEGLGLIGPERPRMIAVQSDGCAPIVRAFEAGDRHAEPWQDADTLAGGLRVPAAVGDFLILDAVRSTKGCALSVPDDAIEKAMRRFARRMGMLVAPEAAATLAGLDTALERGLVDKSERALLFITGSGTKHLDLAAWTAS